MVQWGNKITTFFDFDIIPVRDCCCFASPVVAQLANVVWWGNKR